MARCPITLDDLAEGSMFSAAGLRGFHPRLTALRPLDLTHEEQLRQARLRADKMSIQGVQPKLSAVLRVSEGRFEIVDCGGRFLLKPNPLPFEEVPANEAVTMSMAAVAGIQVPPHGVLPAVDGSWVYVIRRFDRVGSEKRHVEDFAQLSGATRDTKYDSSLERLVGLIETHCTFPAVEKAVLAKRLLFCFLTGNEDMHLKNFSLLVEGQKVSLAPAYDLLNTTLVLENATEESALPLKGKKKNLSKKLWIDYFCRERVTLSSNVIDQILHELQDAIPRWKELLKRCYLSEDRKRRYEDLLEERLVKLGLIHHS